MANESDFFVVRPFAVTASNLTSSNVTETEHPTWNAGTSYGVIGDRVIYNHKVYECINGSGNIGKNPETETTFWIYVSVTNRFKMFDNQVSSQTSEADSIDVLVSYTERPTRLYFGNVECQYIDVEMLDSDDNILFTQRYQMYENTGTPSYFSFFTARLQRKTDLLVTGFPPYANCKFNVSIVNEGAEAKCGVMLAGYAEYVGVTQLGLVLGTRDFSVKRRNDFGDYEILERAYSRFGEANVMVKNAGIDRLIQMLANYRATATLFIASNLYTSSLIYGFYDDYSNSVAYQEASLLNIRMEGLT
jgi:hypothetical protein